MYREETGDLFEGGYEAIGHGVNCQGVMGAGIARVFRNRYPNMYAAYRLLCERGDIPLGGIMIWNTPHVTIYNLATQFNPGADATLEAVRSSVDLALGNCEASGIRELALPRIGCGIGGLEWPSVQAIFQLAAQRYPEVDLVAVTLPGQG